MCGGGNLELRRVSGGSVTGAVGHGGGSPFLALCQLTPSPDAFAQACPLPPASSRGHSGKHNPVQQSKALGFSCFSLHKRSAEPGNRRLQRGWSNLLRGAPEARAQGEPKTFIRQHTPKHPKVDPVFLTSITTLPLLPPQKKFLRVGGCKVGFPRKAFQDSFSNAKPLPTLPRLLRNNS